MVVAEDKKTRRLNKKTRVAHAHWMHPMDYPQEVLPAWKTSSGCVHMQTGRRGFSSFMKKIKIFGLYACSFCLHRTMSDIMSIALSHFFLHYFP